MDGGGGKEEVERGTDKIFQVCGFGVGPQCELWNVDLGRVKEGQVTALLVSSASLADVDELWEVGLEVGERASDDTIRVDRMVEFGRGWELEWEWEWKWKWGRRKRTLWNAWIK